MKGFYSLIFIIVNAVTFCLSLDNSYSNNKFTIESKGPFAEKLLTKLIVYGFTVLYKITESVFMFEYEGHTSSEEIPDLVLSTFGDEVDAIEPIRMYLNDIKQAHAAPNKKDQTSNMKNLVCDYYYGMDVDKVWARNITGLGVTIAITGVGIDTDLDDLEKNINKELSKDLFYNKSDVSPEHFEDYGGDNTPDSSNHGNHVTSVVAAVKGNNLCSSGIAYNATVVGIKTLMINLTGNTFTSIEQGTGTIARSLNYEFNEIDIYANAWRTDFLFDQLDLAARKAIEDAALKGRRGLGAIHVVPAIKYGNFLSNNIYTITVNGIPKPEKLLDDVNHDASVLTSGLKDGNNLTSASMVTTAYGNKCVRSFNGDSAAVAQVSGIIALGLQANPALTLRDVQHLLVNASGYEKIKGRVNPKTNNASRKFSEKFGFGLINADKFVSQAVKHVAVPDLKLRKLSSYETRNAGPETDIFELYDSCKREESCINKLEHVELDISFKSIADNVTLSLISPVGKTESLLMELNLTENDKLKTHKANFVSVHFWDEVPCETWQVKFQSNSSSKNTIVYNISITLYGTRRANQMEDPDHCGSDDINKNSNDTTDILHESTDHTLTIVIVIVVVFVVVAVYVVVGIRIKKCKPCARSSDNGNERENLKTSEGDSQV